MPIYFHETATYEVHRSSRTAVVKVVQHSPRSVVYTRYSSSSTPAAAKPSLCTLKSIKIIRREIEDFVETHPCKLPMILRSRVVRVLCDLMKDVSPY